MSKDKLPVGPHREAWAGEGADWAVRVAEALGALALRADHVGSTAVPGLPAKDVIDIQASVASLDEAAAIIAAMSAAGFRRKPNRERDGAYDGADAADHGRSEADHAKLFFREPAGERPVHVHVRKNGAANNRLALLLRDFLRADERGRASYGAFKLALSDATDKSPKAYAAIKAPFLAMALRAAEEWAAHTRWRPEAPDAYWRSAE